MQVTNEGLLQGYVVVPCAKRFMVLYSFLKRHRSKKVMVFFSSCNSVKFHADVLNHINLDCSSIHGKQKQQTRTTTFTDFCKAEKGVLLCTDVAARGLDIPDVVYSSYLLTYVNIFLWKNNNNFISTIYIRSPLVLRNQLYLSKYYLKKKEV